MKRIEFLKRLLTTFFGAMTVSSFSANPERSQRVKDLGSAEPGRSTQPTPRYLLSATVAGTPYYDFPNVGLQLLQAADPNHRTLSEAEGHSHENDEQLPEHPATLVPEPDNEFDFRAIAVYWNGHKLGYIPQRHNKVLYNLLKDGAQLQALIRLQCQYDENLLVNVDGWQQLYDLRIRVYLLENAV